MKKLSMVAVIPLVLAALLWQESDRSQIQAQSGSRNQSRTQSQQGSGAQQRGESFEARFWNYILGSSPAYLNWAPYPGTDGEATPGESPHGAFLKLYLNRIAAGNPKTLPHGSIIIKENYGPDRKTLMAVTVMYRAKGYDAEHNDWYWVKYRPDGSVDMKNGMPLAGRVKGCIACHSGAEGNDYSFAND